jgi:hypothetical protein
MLGLGQTQSGWVGKGIRNYSRQLKPASAMDQSVAVQTLLMHSRREIDERDESPCYHLCTAERRDESAPQIGRVGYFVSGLFDGLEATGDEGERQRGSARVSIGVCVARPVCSTPPGRRRVGIALYETRDIYI